MTIGTRIVLSKRNPEATHVCYVNPLTESEDYLAEIELKDVETADTESIETLFFGSLVKGRGFVLGTTTEEKEDLVVPIRSNKENVELLRKLADKLEDELPEMFTYTTLGGVTLTSEVLYFVEDSLGGVYRALKTEVYGTVPDIALTYQREPGGEVSVVSFSKIDKLSGLLEVLLGEA